MPLVPTNAMVPDSQQLGNIPIQPGKNVYIRDVATIQDLTSTMAARWSTADVYIPVVKKDTASTLTVVQQIHNSMPLFQSVVPEDVTVRYEFDESPTVRAAIKSVATEGLIGAMLTGLMILIFLRDLRTVLVVLVSIPLSLTAALVGLWLTGNTINIMSLGGLALAIGILVDEATVTLENTHAQMRHTDSIARAARQANSTTATARMLCILSVFIPTFILNEPVRSLFMPLTLSVGFSMIASYLLSSTLVPVASVWLIKHRGDATHQEGFFDRPAALRNISSTRYAVPILSCAACSRRQSGGNRIVSTGGFRPVCASFSDPSRVGIRVDAAHFFDQRLQGKVAISMGYVGLGATNTATNDICYSCGDLMMLSSGCQEGSVRLADLRNGCAIIPWLKEVLGQEGCSPEAAQTRAQKVFLWFRAGRYQHGNEFRLADSGRGVVIGPERNAVRAHALILAEMKKIPSLRDVSFTSNSTTPR